MKRSRPTEDSSACPVHGTFFDFKKLDKKPFSFCPQKRPRRAHSNRQKFPWLPEVGPQNYVTPCTRLCSRLAATWPGRAQANCPPTSCATLRPSWTTYGEMRGVKWIVRTIVMLKFEPFIFAGDEVRGEAHVHRLLRGLHQRQRGQPPKSRARFISLLRS